MGKLLLILSFISLIILSLGTLVMPNYSAFWLASSGINYLAIRLAMAAILMALIMTDPPRNLFLRAVALAFSVVVGCWTIGTTYENHMMFLDSLSLLAAAVAIAITALEVTETSIRPAGNRGHASYLHSRR